MNKQQLLQQARRTIDERRLSAEDKAERLLSSLRENADFTAIERELRQAEVSLAMGDGDTKQLQKTIMQLQRKQAALLSKLGLSVNMLKPQYHCNKCGDTGYVDGKTCSCLQQEIHNLIVAESNVINKLFTFDNTTEASKHNKAVYKKACEICFDGKTNMLLTGNTGSGKTYLLTACANLCMERGKSVLFVTAYTLNGMMLDAHISDSATNKAIMDSLIEVDVLAIDDLGTETVYKNVTAEYFFTVINERIARGKQTFISTNLTLQDIRERYDERMFSRLVDQNTTFVAQLTGEDKRLKKK